MYSLFVLCVQFLLPSIILLLAHIRIYLKLTSLPYWGHATHIVIQEEVDMQTFNGKKREEQKRKRSNRTIYLLVCVVLFFMCSWFPLNLLNVLLDLGLYSTLFG